VLHGNSNRAGLISKVPVVKRKWAVTEKGVIRTGAFLEGAQRWRMDGRCNGFSVVGAGRMKRISAGCARPHLEALPPYLRRTNSTPAPLHPRIS